MPEVIGWLIGAVILVSSGWGFRCMYQTYRKDPNDE